MGSSIFTADTVDTRGKGCHILRRQGMVRESNGETLYGALANIIAARSERSEQSF